MSTPPTDDFRKLLDERHQEVIRRFDNLDDLTAQHNTAIQDIKADLRWMKTIAATVSAIVGAVVSFIANTVWGSSSA